MMAAVAGKAVAVGEAHLVLSLVAGKAVAVEGAHLVLWGVCCAVGPIVLAVCSSFGLGAGLFEATAGAIFGSWPGYPGMASSTIGSDPADSTSCSRMCYPADSTVVEDAMWTMWSVRVFAGVQLEVGRWASSGVWVEAAAAVGKLAGAACGGRCSS